MRKNIILLFLITVGFSFLYCESVNDKGLIKVGFIQVGKEEGRIGYEVFPENPAMPQTFLITDKKVYIPDPLNFRLNIYDLKLNYLGMISNVNKNQLYAAEKLIIDDDENFVFVNHYFGIKKITSSGAVLLHTKRYNLPDEVLWGKNIFVIDNNIFIYNDDYKIGMINDKGTILNNEKALSVMNDLSIQRSAANLELKKGIKFPMESILNIEKLKKDGHFLIVQDLLYSSDYDYNHAYFKEISSLKEKAYEVGVQNREEKRKSEFSLKIHGISFIGYDNEHNSYWDAWTPVDNQKSRKLFVIIYSKHGIFLDSFIYGRLKEYSFDTDMFVTSGSILSVSGLGEIWFLSGSEEGYYVYKLNRQW